MPYDRAKDAISVADQIAWCSVPRECIRDLAGNPIGRSAVRHGNVDQLAAIQSSDDQSIKQVEGKRRDPGQIHRRDLGRMVPEERPPALAGRPAMPSHHVLRDGGLSHLEAELQKLTVDARGAPERVVGTHLRDQRPQLGINLGPPSAIARPPAPVAAKPSAMPPNERLRPDDLEDRDNRWKPAIQLDEEQAVTVGQPRSAPALAP